MQVRCAVLLFALPMAASALAEDAPSPYRVQWPRDLVVTGVAGVVWALPPFFMDDLVRKSCPCNAEGLSFLDRGTAGVSRSGPALASDIAVAAAYTLGAAFDGLDVWTHDASAYGWLEDAVIMGQAIAVNGALTQLFKLSFSRPRPLVYGRPRGDPALDDPENFVSFYSGHTSGAFAATLSYAYTFAQRHPGSPYRIAVYGAAIAIGSTVGALRVLSGKHFPTDVLTGAAAGATLGLLIPWLHARARATEVRVALLPLPSGVGLGLSMTAL